MRLHLHLEDEEPIIYEGEDTLLDVMHKPSIGRSMFLAWFKANKRYKNARDLLYVEFPQEFVYNRKDLIWTPRVRPKVFGRIHYVPPSAGDVYYLRIMLNKVRGPTSYKKLKTVNGTIYPTLNLPGLTLQPEDAKNIVLSYIEDLMVRGGSTLKRIPNMPYPNYERANESTNMLIHDELNYERKSLKEEHDRLFTLLTDEQRNVYQTIMTSVNDEAGGVFFVYGYGGTGDIVINVASSGIASLLLTGRRTAYSRFGIPINLTEDSFCNISPDSDMAALLRKTKLIIWDEAPMMHRHCFEALDRTMRDIIPSTHSKDAEKPFGGKVVVFGGDFRQVLPVIPGASRNEVVNASLNSSYIWDSCQVLRLTTNMRLKVGSNIVDKKEIEVFGKWILDIGEGKLSGHNDGEALIEIPRDILLDDKGDAIASISSCIYPSLSEHLDDPEYFQDRAILVPTNEEVDSINYHLLSLIDGEEKIYYSPDSICPTDDCDAFEKSLYTSDILNAVKLSGVPNHILTLKVGVPVMLLRNIDQANGLCNGTRMQIRKLGEHVIEAKVITGSHSGDIVHIPRMKLVPSDRKIPFRLQRRQFPVVVCFAMTINKSQGQSLSQVGLFLKKSVFSHGQLYVAVSRVKSKKGLKVLVCDEDNNPTNMTKNVVYKEVLQKI
uniref:ATP-dependent DNA helicase PIF1-like n=1 Tax=Erigeron canadensis TaxID=72917 RepID=UPI001CB92690|nr:ATP-dependent DNA helicase PIF1-like [Erigeron canadensis]